MDQKTFVFLCVASVFGLSAIDVATQARPRARDLGIIVGVYPSGARNAITDVDGVRVGHTTIIEGDQVRTGVTAILPHGGNLFQDKVAGAVFVGNAFGKLAGSTQVNELGTIETPIVLTNTLSVGTAMDAVVRYTIAPAGQRAASDRSTPLVGETNDGGLNDIRGLHVTREHVTAGDQRRDRGPVAEGTVGAGTGTVNYGWKGGIGTSSRKLPADRGGYTVGVLAQTNFGGNLTIAGVPIFRMLQPPARTRSRRAAERRPNGGGRFLHAGRGDRCAARCARTRAAGGAGDVRPGAHRIVVQQRQRRFRDRVLDVARNAQPIQRHGAHARTRSCRPTRRRRCSKRRWRPPRKRSTTRCSRRRPCARPIGTAEAIPVDRVREC